MRGIKILIRFFFNLFAKGGYFIGYLAFLPHSIFALFMGYKFFTLLMEKGFKYTMKFLFETLFAAENTIRQNTALAVNNAQAYGFAEFLAIINAFAVIYLFFKYVPRLITWLQGANPNPGGWIVAILVFVIMEVSVMIATQDFFIPIKDGLFEMVFNLKPVLTAWY